jgi:AcrR family transcriptional regulator
MPKKVEEERRRQILNAAAQCIAEEGVDGATMRKIAARANVSTGMLTYYYANKKEIIAAAIATAVEYGNQMLNRIAGRELSPRRLEAFYKLLTVDRDEEIRPWAFWIELWAEAARDPDLHPPDGGFITKAHAWIAQCVRAGIEEGTFAPDLDPELAALILHALVMGLGISTTLDPTAVPATRAFEAAKQAIALLRARPCACAD